MSAASGRYQSRLFNFFHRQTRRVSEQLGSAVRHLQVATQWGVELLLFPFLQLLQPPTPAERTLETSTPNIKLELPPEASDNQTSPQADTPIIRVLQAIEIPTAETTKAVKNNLGFLKLNKSQTLSPNNSTLTYQPTTNSPQTQPKVVRGIASQLSSRTLVLITPTNQILDILSPQQQQQIQARILDEVAQYWSYWRLGEKNQPVAALNSTGTLTFIDTAVAKLESTTVQPAVELMQFVQSQFQLFLYGETGTVAAKEPQKWDINALISAAVDYFFGDDKGKKFQPIPSTKITLPNSQFLPRQVLAGADILDPWLDESDLFGNSQTIISKTADASIVLPPSRSGGEALVNLFKRGQKFAPKFEQASTLVKRQKSTRSLTKVEKVAAKITKALEVNESRLAVVKDKNKNTGIFAQKSQNNQVEAKPDWINGEAKIVGYIKHPLEQILEWLDRAMLWLEELFVKIWQSLQVLWRGK